METTRRDPKVEQVREQLEHRLAEIDSPERADEALSEMEQRAAGRTEEQAGERVAKASVTPATLPPTIAKAETPAQAVVQTAAQAVAPSLAAAVAAEGAQAAFSPRVTPDTPEASRGRTLLKQAALRRMSPLEAADASLYLVVNGGRHPLWLDRVGALLALVTRGGTAWAVAVLLAYALRVPRSWEALWQMLPSVVGATLLVEYPIKRFVRRRRPFVDVVRAVVVGKMPGSWSYPSGHTTSSFACARVLASVWPERAGLFYISASIVGLSRVYVGDHYPGDVLGGALIGSVLSELIQRAVRRALRFGD